MIKPIIPKNDPNESAITPPKDENGCFVRIALRTTHNITLSTGLRSLKDKIMYITNGTNPTIGDILNNMRILLLIIR
jgi:hypothetical protein